MKSNKKQLIKEVAMDLFGQKGYEDTSLSDIASSVGMKKPSLYNHFESKDELFIEVLAELVESEVRAYQRAAEEMNPEEPLLNVKKLFDLFCLRLMTTKEALLWKRVTFFPPPQFKEQIQEKFMHFEKVTSSLLSSMYKEGLKQHYFNGIDENEFIASFLCLVDGVFLEHHYYSEEIFQQRIGSAWKVYELGITSHKGE
ncbi:TetR/AcrR family transcriptional regulator [Bacillus sp. KH172YL63]|uniref:TetR/AcrR family transcriptional regulator n=1 Tax=Bacillus sp. KH172YL63 TaxID=2709784 RepID=UPI0013E4326E|nr:TetR/AcrR family transcriptional regulator [Bacillus sp. KH172YL63]BCB04315.1 TetR family transcriptional regulator [Bacillus sp. KH172YL63]